ncbi:hypothetical protein B4U80_10852, partial [Leptotrombidium deliense]
LSDKGLQPGLSKVDAIVNFPTPKTPRQVRSFLGLVGYFKRCIPGYSELTYNMRRVTKKRDKAEWNEQCSVDFNKLKDLIVKAPVLMVFNPKKPSQVHTDACQLRLGAILLQYGEDGLLHPVMYISRATTEAEMRYHATELELLC